MTNLILCGGAGTRLWPLSRNSMPKQFYPLFDHQSLFEQTVVRNRGFADRYWVASNAVQQGLAQAQMARCGVSDFGCLVEPEGRNTAPAIALVCLTLPADELVFVTPSDHRIARAEEYERAVTRGMVLAREGHLVTFGIRPSYPETGFGYIEFDGELVTRFREKPDLETAEAYIGSGRFLWNSGMFLFKAGVFLDELKLHCPEVHRQAVAALEGSTPGDNLTPSLEAMRSIPSISIDYAVMEKTKRARVVSCDPGWSDLGSFDALFDEVSQGQSGNIALGSDLPLFIDSHNDLVVSSGRKVVLVDADDLMVIDTEDALLIVKRGSSQKVKDVVGQLRALRSDLLD